MRQTNEPLAGAKASEDKFEPLPLDFAEETKVAEARDVRFQATPAEQDAPPW